MAHKVPVHYLRGNARESSPGRLFVWDTETMPQPGTAGTVQVLRCWQAELVIRSGPYPDAVKVERYAGTTAAQLASTVVSVLRTSESTWCYAHNLGFDLAVTRLPVLLAGEGFELTQHALAADAPWAMLARGEHRLRLVDSYSVIPAPLHEIGRLVGIVKPELPDDAAELSLWAERCAADVAILRVALCQVMDWWDAEGAGNWSVTGPATGFSLYRHLHLGQRILIRHDAQAMAWERLAMTGGRREAIRVGRLPPGLFADLDFEHAHASVCAHLPLPVRRFKRFESLALDTELLHTQLVDVAAEVELQTETPRYPVRMAGDVLYPVGHFRTHLCGPEIREARLRGELVAIGEGYAYQVSAHMASWARWLLANMDSPPAAMPPVVGPVLKAWSRTVPGRWAARTGIEVYQLPDPRPGWHLEEGALMPGFRPARYLTLGGVQHVIAQDQPGDNCFPAVLSWVQSWTRVLLGRLIDALGRDVVQVNTDGCLVDLAGWYRVHTGLADGHLHGRTDLVQDLIAHLEAHAAEWATLRVRVKRLAERVRIYGPQHVIMDREQRLSGVPRGAVEVAPDTWSFTAWPRLPAQIGQEGAEGYVHQLRTVRLDMVPVARWRIVDGLTEPPECYLDELGRTRVRRPDDWDVGQGFYLPAEQQHPALRAALRG